MIHTYDHTQTRVVVCVCGVRVCVREIPSTIIGTEIVEAYLVRIFTDLNSMATKQIRAYIQDISFCSSTLSNTMFISYRHAVSE